MTKDVYLRNIIDWEGSKEIDSNLIDSRYLLLSKIDGYYYFYHFYFYLNRIYYTY